MSLSIIVAMDNKRVIGRDNQLPWHLPEDLKRFKQITTGHPIVMGRKTFASIGKILPGRENIVLTKNPDFQSEGITVAKSFDEIVERSKKGEELFIIGGSEIFKTALPHVSKIYLTLIDDEFDGDVFFPEINLKEKFKVAEETAWLISEKSGLPYRFSTLERIEE